MVAPWWIPVMVAPWWIPGMVASWWIPGVVASWWIPAKCATTVLECRGEGTELELTISLHVAAAIHCGLGHYWRERREGWEEACQRGRRAEGEGHSV